MFLISWNVAGWSSTSALIRESYGSVAAFFELTGADIICIQECKGTWAKLQADPVAMGASDPSARTRKSLPPRVAPLVVEGGAAAGDAAPPPPCPGAGAAGGLEGWESFWALSGAKHRGFNGVVTFARKGLTWRCNNTPFGESELDSEGRVVVTHHSAFVLVNVYVPNARGGERAAFKLRFLERLKALMDDLRTETGRPVVLVGDLNMTYRPEDASWTLQRVGLAQLIELNAEAQAVLAACGGGPALPDAAEATWAAQSPHLTLTALRRLSNAVASTLAAQLVEAVRVDAVEKETGKVTHRGGTGSGTSVVSVDTPIEVPDAARRLARARALAARIEQSGGPTLGLAGGLSFADPVVSLEELYDCGLRSLFAEDLTARMPVAHHRELFALLKRCGLPPHGHESVRFMSSLLHETCWRHDADVALDGLAEVPLSGVRMVDTFRLGEERDGPAYCPCPFTCWDQSRNKRSSNDGTRLDYILVDHTLTSALVPRGNTANNTGFTLATDRGSSGLSAPSQGATSPLARLACAEQIVVHPPASLRVPRPRESNPFFSAYAGVERADAVCRAMADGLYPPAPYDRSGLPPLHDHARGCPMCGLPSTGLFVTPPQFSDHIGVCALFRSGEGGVVLEPRPGKLVEDSGMCVYRPPVGLRSFFARAAPPPPVATANEQTLVRSADSPPRKLERRESAEDHPAGVEVVDIDVD